MKNVIIEPLVTIITTGFLSLILSLHPLSTTISETVQKDIVNTQVSEYLVSETEADRVIIPDSYNTGASGEQPLVKLGDTVSGIPLSKANNGTANAIDFAKKNLRLASTMELKNFDFSDYQLVTYRETTVTKPVTIVFRNCKFQRVVTGREESNVTYQFENCTFEGFTGSNANFTRCQFGKSYTDGLVPFVNVVVKDCYFSDFSSEEESGKGKHSDGTQIYGYKDLDAQNILYENCRFEIPPIMTGENSATINACIMLQMEYSDGKDIIFRNCYVNGGGYTIYARSKKSAFKLSDVFLDRIKVGNAMLYDILYPDIAQGVTITDVVATTHLYVGSIWRESGKTHVSVSNDTSIERQLVIYADGKLTEFTIPACPDGNHALPRFADYPFDIDIVIPGECGYVICFDKTNEEDVIQIRFDNQTGKKIYMDEKSYKELHSIHDTEPVIIKEGSCGKKVRFTLDDTGTLTLEGKGATYDYHSAKLPPWAEYKEQIIKVYIAPGIDTLGEQIFRGCPNLNEVELNEGLKVIKKRAFNKCSMLERMNLPGSIERIAAYSLNGTFLQSVSYADDKESFMKVNVEEGNEVLEEVIEYKK